MRSGFDRSELRNQETPVYLGKDFLTLEEAVRALTGRNVVLVINSGVNLEKSVVVTPNVTLRFDDRGELRIPAGAELTIQGSVLAPAKRIFRGPGTVNFKGNNSRPVLLPEWWGAAGNGVLDDSQSIQAAVLAVGTSLSGGTVELTKPRYLCTATLNIGSNVRLIGGPPRNGLFFQNKAGIATAIQIIDAHSVEISDLTVEGSSATPTVGRLISIERGSDIHVKHCLLTGASLKPKTGQISAIAFENSNNIWIEDNETARNGPVSGDPFGVEIGGYLLGGSQIHVRRNKIRGYRTLYGIHISDPSNSDVLDNDIDLGNQDNRDNHSGYGITLYSLKAPNDVSNEVSGNTVANCAGEGIYFVGIDHGKITGNTVLNVATKQSDSVLGVGAISLNQTDDIEVRNNVLKHSGKAGIVLANTNQVLVESNTIQDTSEAGIWLRQSERQTSLLENTIDTSAEAGIRVTMESSGLQIVRNQVSHTGTWGIIVVSSAPGGLISDNSIRSVASGGGIYVGGGATTLHHNEIRDIRGSGIDHRGGGATIDRNLIVGLDPGRTIHGILGSGGNDYVIEYNEISNCLQGVNLSEAGGRVTSNILRGNTTPLTLSKAVSASDNVPMMR